VRHSKTKEATFFETKEFKDVIIEAKDGKGDEGKEDDLDFAVDVKVGGDEDVAHLEDGEEDDEENRDRKDD